MLVGGSAPGNIWGPADGGTEGPERGAEARSAGAPRGWGLAKGAVAPPQHGVWKIFQKSTLKSRIFGILQAAVVFSVVASRQD